MKIIIDTRTLTKKRCDMDKQEMEKKQYEDEIAMLANNKIHIHLYSDSYYDHHDLFNRQAKKVAPRHFHVHRHSPQNEWVKEFSKYDAGWLHCFNSHNHGVIRDAGWDDLNIPARMYTLAAAGLPMIQKNNDGHIVAMQNRIKRDHAGIFYTDMKDLIEQLRNQALMSQIRNNVINRRLSFCFDNYVPALIDFFREIINHSKKCYDYN